jgi:hypothetical protein
MTVSSVPDFYGVPGQGVVEQVDTITLSHTAPAALSKTGIVSVPAKETQGNAPTADVISVFDVTTSTPLVQGTDYVLTPSGTAPESLTYSVTRVNSSSASADTDTARVTYRYGMQQDQVFNFGGFQGQAGAAPAGTQGQAANFDSEGSSAGGTGSAAGYGSLTDPAAGSQSSSETGSPGSEYAVTGTAPGPLGSALGSPDTEGTYGGGLPENFTPAGTGLTGTLETATGGGENLQPGMYSSPNGYRAPSSGVAGSTKDTTLTDILGNQVNANPLPVNAAYAAHVIDTEYSGAPAAPTRLASQTDAFSAAAEGAPLYLSQKGLVPATIVVTDTTAPAAMVLTTDYTLTIAGNGEETTAFITPVGGGAFTAGDNVSVTYSYGDATYYGSNTPASVPAAPGTPSVTAVNRGVSCTWAVPAGLTPVDYYLLEAEDRGTLYVPASGQPVLDGQPSPSGGASVGEPAYQADTFDALAAALSAPSAPSPTTAGTGGTVAAGTYKVTRTYVNGSGETVASSQGTVVTTGATSTITVPSPSAVTGATGWYAYASQAGGSTLTRQQAAGHPTAIGTPLVITAPPTSSGAQAPAANTSLPVTSKQGVVTPAGQIIVRNVSGTENDPMQPDGTVLELGYDYTVTQVGTGPWAQYQIAILGTSQNVKAGDTIIVEYWYGADPSSVTAVFTQGLTPNTPVIYKPDGTTPYSQGYRFRVAAGNKAGLGPFSAYSSYAVPLNYNAPQPGHEGSTQTGTGALDPANAINPVYRPDGTVLAGTGVGG